MKRKSYEVEAEKLSKAIDIAIKAFSKHAPKELEQSQLNHIVGCYQNWKDQALHPEPQFKKIGSLKYLVESVLTYFQEGTGEAVEYFWKKIKEEGLDYEKENKLEKILTRGKIKTRIEYEYVTDMIVVAEQTGMTTPEESKRLSQMIGEFEIKKRR